MNITYDEQANALAIDGEPVGALDADTIVLHSEQPPVVKGKLRKHLEEAGYEISGFAQAPAATPAPDQEQPPATDPPTGDGGATAPPMPVPDDPTLGDKDPKVVEWYRDNDPEEFRRRYAGRKTHLGVI